MAIYDDNNVTVTKRVQKAISRPSVNVIKNKTLDGKWHIQTIGNSSTTVDVIAHLTMGEKVIFDDLKRASSIIKVEFDGFYYNGLIDGDPSYERIPSSNGPIFIVTFTLLVLVEGVI